MILLIVGWHLTLIGIVAIVLGLIYGARPYVTYFGLGALVVGLLLSFIFRKACASYESDTVDKTKVDAPLDYY